MKIQITTTKHDEQETWTISMHNKFVKYVNELFTLQEEGAHGGYGYYHTDAEIEYYTLSEPLATILDYSNGDWMYDLKFNVFYMVKVFR